MIMVTEYFLSGKIPHRLNLISVFLMMLGTFYFTPFSSSSKTNTNAGTVIGGFADLFFDVSGYGFVLLNNLFTTIYMIYTKALFSSSKMTPLDLMRYNAILSMPFLAVLFLLSGERQLVLGFKLFFAAGFQAALIFSSLFAFGVNFTSYWCTQTNSALTTSVIGLRSYPACWLVCLPADLILQAR